MTGQPRVRGIVPQLAEQNEAGQPGRRHLREHQIRPPMASGDQRGIAIRHGQDRPAFAQRAGDMFPRVGVVVDQEDAHVRFGLLQCAGLAAR
jgi:hypothetical protein